VATEAEKNIEKPQLLYTFSAKYGAVPVGTKKSKQKFNSSEKNLNEHENEKRMAETHREAPYETGSKKIKGRNFLHTRKPSQPFIFKPSNNSNPGIPYLIPTNIDDETPKESKSFIQPELPIQQKLLNKSDIFDSQNVSYDIEPQNLLNKYTFSEKEKSYAIYQELTKSEEAFQIKTLKDPQSTKEIQSINPLNNPLANIPDKESKSRIPPLTQIYNLSGNAVNDDNFTSSTSDSGYVSADYPRNRTQIIAKSSRPIPTITQQIESTKTTTNSSPNIKTPIKIKSKRQALKTKFPDKVENTKIGISATTKQRNRKALSPANECNLVGMKRIASFDNSEQLEDFLFSQKHQNKTIAKKSARYRNLILEKKIAREKHQKSCKTYRANRKREITDSILELDNLTKRNKLLQEKEARLREKVDKLKEYYLYALKNNCFSCKNC